jgi:hypothetical protein
MKTFVRRPYLLTYLIVCLGLFSFRCDQFFPEDFQEQEFSIDSFDEDACDLMTRPLNRNDSLLVIDSLGTNITIPIEDLGDYPGMTILDTIVNTVPQFYPLSPRWRTLSVRFDSLLSDTLDTLYVLERNGASDSVLYTDSLSHDDSLAIADTVYILVRDVTMTNAVFDNFITKVDTLPADTLIRMSNRDSVNVLYLIYDPTVAGNPADFVLFMNEFVEVSFVNRDGYILKKVKRS